jgi:hypothetical protein
MPKSRLTKFVQRVIHSNEDASPSFSAIPPNNSGNFALPHQGPSSRHVAIQEPFESVVHIDIPPPPTAPQEKAPTVLLPRLSRHSRRKLAAARRWNTEVLPALIKPFMAYERMTQSGSVALSENGVEHYLCNCLRRQPLSITCVYLDRQFNLI